MARPAQYDPASVTQRAMEVFWRRGYAATSIDHLLRETGLNRHSLYHRFGGKEGLFAAGLDHYRQHYARHYLTCLRRARGMQALRGYFSSIIGSQDPRGCLIVNTALETELPNGCDQVIAGHCMELRQCLCKALTEAQADGELCSSLDPASTAAWLQTLIQGLSVQLRQTGELALNLDDLLAALAARPGS